MRLLLFGLMGPFAAALQSLRDAAPGRRCAPVRDRANFRRAQMSQTGDEQ
jgi:hypothetical protein